MRLALTVVSPGAHGAADVVLDADPATPVARSLPSSGAYGPRLDRAGHAPVW